MPAGWSPPPPRDPQPARRSRSARAEARQRSAADHRPGVLQLDHEGVWVAYPTLLERLESHVLGDRLDRTLAAGVRPECDVLLALRAQRLACIGTRRELAMSVQRLIDASQQTSRTLSPVASMAVLSRVATTRPELESLVEHLVAPVPVSARGVALVRLMLRDGSGPLYRFESKGDLAAMVRSTIAALDPTRDWPD